MKIVTKKGYEEYAKMLSLRDELIMDFKKYINNVAISFEEIYDLMEHDVADCELADNPKISEIDDFWKIYHIYSRVILDKVYTLGEDISFEYDSNSEAEMTEEDYKSLQYLADKFMKYFEIVALKVNRDTQKIIELKDIMCDVLGVDEENIEELNCGWNEDESQNCVLEAIRISKRAVENKREFREMFLNNENIQHLKSIKDGQTKNIQLKAKR